MFKYKWFLKDGYPDEGIDRHMCKVFGTFVCGGGSTMGYKRAGFDHLGGVEIDPNVAHVYQENHSPKHLFIEDIRIFNERNDLPDELYILDILDASPPCSTFSTSGSREKGWAKNKKFKEGQSTQILDNLVFVYCETIKKLRPKVFLLENVTGILKGNAKVYSKKIFQTMVEAGYNVQVFVLNAASMGVPQKRERVFFIGHLKEFSLPKLRLEFNEKPILFRDIKGAMGKPNSVHDNSIWENRIITDKDFGETLLRMGKKESNWNSKYIHKNQVCNTITSTSGSKLIEFDHPFHLSDEKIIQIGSFPIDYDFKVIEPKYLIGMSVPPVMTAQIAYQIYLQWLSKI